MTYLGTRARNLVRRAIQSWGPPAAKRRLWNEEFASGHWDHLAETRGDCVYAFVEKYCAGGDLLDLGCGSGNTGCELDARAYGSYVGVDISDVAIRLAARRAEAAGRWSTNTYVQSDIATFMPERTFDVILFRESLNYIPTASVASVLERYRGRLTARGVIIVRLYDRTRHADLCSVIGERFAVVEKFEPADQPTIVLVFR